MEAARRRGGLAALSSLGVEHPPGALPRALILHPDEPAVQGQVVPDGILGRKETGQNV